MENKGLKPHHWIALVIDGTSTEAEVLLHAHHDLHRAARMNLYQLSVRGGLHRLGQGGVGLAPAAMPVGLSAEGVDPRNFLFGGEARERSLGKEVCAHHGCGTRRCTIVVIHEMVSGKDSTSIVVAIRVLFGALSPRPTALFGFALDTPH